MSVSRASRPAVALAALALAACAGGAPEGPRERLERALEIEGATPPGFEAEGWVDLAARGQAHHPAPGTRHPVRERFLVDPATGRVAHEQHARVNADADEHMRFVHDDSSRAWISDRLAGWSSWVADPDLGRAAARLRRTQPAALLRELLDGPAELAAAGDSSLAGVDYRLVAASLPAAGLELVLWFSGDHRLSGVHYWIELPVRGRVPVRWEFDEEGYAIEVDGTRWREMSYTRRGGPGEFGDLLEVGDGLPAPPAAGGASERPPQELRWLADGVYLAPGVRPGFHHLVVDLGDRVAVVDAPSGYHELRHLPAPDWAGLDDPLQASRRLLDAIDGQWPGRPAPELVLTHHHFDHSGGLGAFLERGSRVWATPATIGALQPFFPGASFVPVEGRATLPAAGDGPVLQLVDVGENPHAEGMLVAWLPGPGILYQSDLFEPWGGGGPNPARVPVMEWFTGWLDDSGLEPGAIFAVHGSARVTAGQLERIREGR